ncbi:unnamed protein product [Dovyalis caffra]|uniref:F-box domain-containing protein n=1 Tax=Dovyalis caffra TaxID=77055 RepID=A0AAV1SKV7_9ROSI|nr:unnamed protein product [Dovyalis caffra]
MGQSSSITNDRTNRFLTPAIISPEPSDFTDEIEVGPLRDYTEDIPDECLASIFQLLNAGDRKRASVVCKRWLRVDGQSRCRLSLNAESEIISYIPSIFTRFDSVAKLSLRCDRKSASLNDEALLMISIRCENLTRLKLRGCCGVTELGIANFAKNCKKLTKFSCCSCNFGVKGINWILKYGTNLEELTVNRLRSGNDWDDLIIPGAAASSLKSICLKDLVDGQCFEPLLVESKKLMTLKVIRCLGEWDNALVKIGNGNGFLTDVHLERLQVSDIGLSAISKCVNIDSLRIVKNPGCSDLGLVSVAENCKKLRKLHIDGWKINRIGDEGLIAVAKQCPELQELVLIGVHVTHLSMAAIASNCQRLERLALCRSGTIGDVEIECVAAKCVELRKLCIKGCAISDVAIGALAWGCPNLVKVKVKKCTGVSSEVLDWFLLEDFGGFGIHVTAEDLLEYLEKEIGPILAAFSDLKFVPDDIPYDSYLEVDDENNKLYERKASAWCLVSYHPHWVKKSLELQDADGSGISSMLSFAWIAADYLARIKIQHRGTKTFTLLSLTGSALDAEIGRMRSQCIGKGQT